MRWTTGTLMLVLCVGFSSSCLADFGRGLQAEERGDYEAARREYLKAARDGDARAENNLGLLYRKGLGGAVQFKKAFYWLSKAAEAGQTNAQTSVGDMYETGDAGAANYPAAVYWYRRAAISGFFIAQLSLGEMLESGKGCQQDNVAALAWYKIAWQARVNPKNQYAVEEVKKAIQAMDSLAPRLSKDERDAAEDLASGWRPGHDLGDTTGQVLSERERQLDQREHRLDERQRELDDQTAVSAQEERQRDEQQQESMQQEAAERKRKIRLCMAAMLGRPTYSGSMGESSSNAALCKRDPQAALTMPRPLSTVPSQEEGGGAATGTAVYKGEQPSGMNKVCFYDRGGSAVAITIPVTQLCPLNLD